MNCQECDKELTRNQKKFCDRACQNRYYAGSPRNPELPKYEKICPVCEKIFLATRRSRKYCSEECNWKVQWKKRKARNPRKQSKEWLWRQRRPIILAGQQNECWLCGKIIDGKYEVHHLKGDKDPFSKDVAALHVGCHKSLHSISVRLDHEGRLTFHGKALTYLKEKK